MVYNGVVSTHMSVFRTTEVVFSEVRTMVDSAAIGLIISIFHRHRAARRTTLGRINLSVSQILPILRQVICAHT